MAISNDNSPPRGPEQMNDPALGVVAISYGGGNQSLEAYRVRGIHVNAAGNLNVEMLDGSTGVLAVNAGSVYPYRIRTIYQASSTATGYVLV